jgi:homogentisate 1,2-dioxygenase
MRAIKTQVLKYLSGFGSHFKTEAIEGALPIARNSPQKCVSGLYAEQISGTAFIAPRTENQIPVINNSLDKRQRLNSFYTMLSVYYTMLML